MTEPTLVGPLREAHLADEPGLDPVVTPPLRRPDLER